MADVDEIPDVVKPGEIIDGKYLVEARLGAGGMGVVVAARRVDRPTGPKVAIKLLFPAALANREAIARFSREAKAAARLKSEHAVKVIDVGRMPSGAPYLVMEHLEGADLAAVLAHGGPVPIALAVDYLLQACEALAEAHALGIVHRDLKSANLFLTRRADGTPCVKVLDFGISKMLELDGGEGGTVLTATQAMLGSPAYMPPEQLVSAKHVDARSDIWGLGVIFYELVTGSLPFGGASMMQLFTGIAREAPAPLPPAVPSEVAAVILKCLQKAPADRYPDIGAFVSAVAPFASPAARAAAPGRVALRAASAAQRALPVDEDARTLLMDEPSNPAAARTLDEARPQARAPSRVSLLAAGMALSLALFGGAGLVFLRLQGRATGGPEASAPPAAGASSEPTAAATAPAEAVSIASSSSSAPAAAASSPLTASAVAEPPPEASSAPAPLPRASGAKPRPPAADPFDTRR